MHATPMTASAIVQTGVRHSRLAPATTIAMAGSQNTANAGNGLEKISRDLRVFVRDSINLRPSAAFILQSESNSASTRHFFWNSTGAGIHGQGTNYTVSLPTTHIEPVVINFGSLGRFGTKGHMGDTLALGQDLKEIAVLLRKYRHDGQMRTVEEILATLNTPTPDFQRLCGIEMWGGAGAVWDVNIAPSPTSDEEKADREAFFRAFVRLAKTMNSIGLGSARSDSIAATFQTWVDKGL